MTGANRFRFLLDESVDVRGVPHLREHGHDATCLVWDYRRGMADNEVLQLCMREQRILLTADRDFGELVFVHRQPHAGVIYLRLGDYVELAVKVERLDYVLARHAADLDQFLVVTRDRVRIRRR